MSAERLRQAAVKIRGIADAVITMGLDAETWVDFTPRDPFDQQVMLWSPPVALAVADWLDDIATRHAPSTDTLDLVLHYFSDEPCETCEDTGHPSIVCEGCFPSYEGMDGHAVYPCRETRRAMVLADLILGETL